VGIRGISIREMREVLLGHYSGGGGGGGGGGPRGEREVGRKYRWNGEKK